MSRIAVAMAAAVVALVLGLDAGAAEEREREDGPSLSVIGHGKVSATPDVAEISVGVLTQGATAKEAMTANNEAMSKLLGALKERGIATKDVQTTHINITPHYSQVAPAGAPAGEFAPKIVGYQVSNTVRVTVREITRLGQVLDSVVQSGGNQMHGIEFRFDDCEKLLDQARKRAMADARRKAELLAAEAGVALGVPMSIHEGTAPPPPTRPMMMHALGHGAMAPESSLPVAAGEQDLTATVEVVYRIRP